MSSEILELPPPIYQKLITAASENGQTPVDWIASRLSQPANGKQAPTDAEVVEANANLRVHRIPSGSSSTDNAGIDTDLARAYAVEPVQ